MILKILKLHSPKGSCNFENFQTHSYLLITNFTRGSAISYTNSRGLSKDLQRQKGIHTYTIHKIDLLECHTFWSIFGEHAIVALQDTCMPIEIINDYEWLGKVVLWCSIFLSGTANMNPKINL